MVRETPSTRRAARGRRNGNAGNSGRWITTYADAVTILMAFFVMLYAMSEIDTMKFTAFLEGLRVPFGNSAGEGLLPSTDGLLPESPPPSPVTGGVERRDAPDDLDPDLRDLLGEIQASGVSEDRLQQLLQEGSQQRDNGHDQLADVEAELAGALQAAQLDEHVELRREERGLVVSIASDDILFALGSTVIDPVGREIIEVVATSLGEFDNPLLIEGHTDDVPLDRAGYTNWNLSTDRAVAVLGLMVEQHGLPPTRVAAAGYSEYHPLEDNATDEGRARNRRVDIVVLVEQAALSLNDRATLTQDPR